MCPASLSRRKVRVLRSNAARCRPVCDRSPDGFMETNETTDHGLEDEVVFVHYAV